MPKLVFLDVDDTFLTPPYDAIKKVATLLGVQNFPEEERFIDRHDIEFYLAFPNIFKTKNRMWLFVLASLPFGFFRSYKLHKEINKASLTQLLNDPRVIVLSKNPPSFAGQRIKRIKELTQVKLGKRYIACGPIFKKSTPKIDIIKKIAQERGLALDECLIIDDSVENVDDALRAGTRAMLIEAVWNQQVRDDFQLKFGDSFLSIKREAFVAKALNLLDDANPSPKAVEKIFIIPDNSVKHVEAAKKQIARKSGYAAKNFIILEDKSLFNIFKKGPHNRAIESFRDLLRRPDFLDLDLILTDRNGMEVTIDREQRRQFLVKQAELEIATAVRFRMFCRKIFESKGYIFGTPSLFNLYYRSREEVVSQIRADSLVKNAILEFIRTEKSTSTQAESICNRHINSMIFHRTYRGYFLVTTPLNYLLKKIFRSVNYSFPQNIKDLEETHFTIFAPIHRSYLDSGVLFSVLAGNRQHYPYIVAADKMLDVWLGRFGTFVGAFFIKRKHVDVIYSAVVAAHLKQIHADGASLEVFIEGARSRSGLTLPPKKGIINAVDANRSLFPDRKVAIVPVAFVYNMLPEGEVLLSEVYEEKRKEGKVSLKEQADYLVKKHEKKSFFKKFTVIKKLLTLSSVADCYIEFGEPVILGENNEQHGRIVDIRKTAPIEAALNEVMYRINRMTPVLPSSVICLALLSSKDHHATRDTVESFMRLSQKLVSRYNLTNCATFDENQVDSLLSNSLELPFLNRKFKEKNIRENWIISLSALDSTRALHYKNNILHFFVLPAILANILTFSTKPIKKEELHRYLGHLFRDLSIKYFLPVVVDFNKLIDDFLEIFVEANFISVKADLFVFKGETESNSSFMLLSKIADDFAQGDLLYAFSKFRRTFNRIELEINTNLEFENETRDVTVRNLSIGGALLTSDQPLPLEKPLCLYLPFEGRKHLFTGHIRRAEDSIYGIEFIDVDDNQRNLLIVILSHYSSENFVGNAQPLRQEMEASIPILKVSK